MSQVWLITGSSRGFGKALAEAVLAAGHRLVATARQPVQLEALAQRYGDQVRTVALDVTDAVAAQNAVQAAVDAFGRLDVVVNNAGYGNLATVEEGSDDDFRAQMETNFFGTVNVTRAALPVLRRQRSGHIVQFSSIGGRIGVPGMAAYQSAKWAVEGFSEVLAKEVSAFGIKVTLVEPGGFRTDWGGPSMTVYAPSTDSEYAAVLAPMMAMRKQHAGNETGDPDKAAQAILSIAGIPQPPLRLLLGSDAVYLAGQQAAKMATEDAQWRALSLSTDFDLSPQAAEERDRMLRAVI
ncbi:MAG TPA: oxidoreductase [Dyella sp.]|uniref:oxidoreductase n=1 Tax=Dyella sp. TaxID=1869338 RepID=UPI002D787AD9|nr:oxidoreductase [Dyella sp.]HET6554444.1 oxidoreductase [Dyella sp.]